MTLASSDPLQSCNPRLWWIHWPEQIYIYITPTAQPPGLYKGGYEVGNKAWKWSELPQKYHKILLGKVIMKKFSLWAYHSLGQTHRSWLSSITPKRTERPATSENSVDHTRLVVGITSQTRCLHRGSGSSISKNTCGICWDTINIRNTICISI